MHFDKYLIPSSFIWILDLRFRFEILDSWEWERWGVGEWYMGRMFE
jgi:hypothetical protein